MLVQCAIMWHLTLTTQSGSVMALAVVFGFLPQAVVSVFGGVWADRLDRKMLIMGADAMIATATLALALLMLGGADDLWLIYVALVIRSAGAGVQMPAVSALLPQIVPTDKLLRVNGVNSTIQSAMLLVAPAAAAEVYAGSSIVAVFWIDIVTAIIGIGLLSRLVVARLVRPEVASEARTRYFDDMVGGLRYATPHAFVRWLLALYAVVFVLIVAPSSLTALMVVRTFGPEVWKLTVNEIAFSVGMLVGGALLATWGGVKNRVAMIVAATLVLCALSVALGLSTHLFVFFGFQLIVGLAVPLFANDVDDGAAGDGRAGDAGSGVRVRWHRRGCRDADRRAQVVVATPDRGRCSRWLEGRAGRRVAGWVSMFGICSGVRCVLGSV